MKKLRTMMAFMLAAVAIIAVSCSDDDDDNNGDGGSVQTASIGLPNITDNKVSIMTGTTYQIEAQLLNSNDANPEFEYRIANELVARVSETGLITAMNVPGQTNVQVSYKADPAVTTYFVLEVATVLVESVQLNPPAEERVDLGAEFNLAPKFTVLPAGATNTRVDYKVTLPDGSETTDVSISEAGIFTATQTGTYYVYGMSNQNNEIISAPLVIKVGADVASVETTQATVNIGVGDQIDYAPYFEVLPADAFDNSLTYEIVSGQEFIASEDGTTITVGQAMGTIVVRATSVDDDTKTADLSIVIAPVSPTSLTLHTSGQIPDILYVNVGSALAESRSIANYFNFAPANAEITYTSDNTAVVDIVDGEPVFVAEGTANIRAANFDGSMYVDLPVNVVPVPAVPVEGFNSGGTTTLAGLFVNQWQRIDGNSASFTNATPPTIAWEDCYIRSHDPAKMVVRKNGADVEVMLTDQAVNMQRVNFDIFATDGSQVYGSFRAWKM